MFEGRSSRAQYVFLRGRGADDRGFMLRNLHLLRKIAPAIRRSGRRSGTVYIRSRRIDFFVSPNIEKWAQSPITNRSVFLKL